MYQWIFVLGLFLHFIMRGELEQTIVQIFRNICWSQGFNLKQAVIIASTFEFSGAVLMGSHVTDTVRKTVSTEQFEANPALMYGMLCADLASAIWLIAYFKYPVSTHLIGAIVGFSLAYSGSDGVDWEVIGFIVLSWIASPLLAGIIAFVVFSTAEIGVPKSASIYFNSLPILTFFTFFINVLFIIYKGTPNLDLDELPLWKCILTSMGIGILTALGAQYLYLPYVKKRIENNNNERQENVEEPVENQLNESSTDDDVFVAERTASYNEAMATESKNFVYDNNKDLETNILESKIYTNELMKKIHEEMIADHHENAVVLMKDQII